MTGWRMAWDKGRKILQGCEMNPGIFYLHVTEDLIQFLNWSELDTHHWGINLLNVFIVLNILHPKVFYVQNVEWQFRRQYICKLCCLDVFLVLFFYMWRKSIQFNIISLFSIKPFCFDVFLSCILSLISMLCVVAFCSFWICSVQQETHTQEFFFKKYNFLSRGRLKHFNNILLSCLRIWKLIYCRLQLKKRDIQESLFFMFSRRFPMRKLRFWMWLIQLIGSWTMPIVLVED